MTRHLKKAHNRGLSLFILNMSLAALMIWAAVAQAGLLGGQYFRDALVKVETVTNAPDYLNP